MFGVDGMSWVHGRSTLCLVFDGGLGILNYVHLSELLDKAVYQRLSSIFK